MKNHIEHILTNDLREAYDYLYDSGADDSAFDVSENQPAGKNRKKVVNYRYAGKRSNPFAFIVNSGERVNYHLFYIRKPREGDLSIIEDQFVEDDFSVNNRGEITIKVYNLYSASKVWEVVKKYIYSDHMEELLEKSEALNSEFSRIFDYGPVDNSKRVIASWLMCLVALEHSVSLRQLMLQGNYTSAICIMRPQFEAQIRAMWLFYAASDHKIESTMKSMNERSMNADQKPTSAEMIKGLTGKAPKIAVLMLNDFKDETWAALNSYVHGGIHAMQRHGAGYPEELIENIIKNSNALLSMTAMMAAKLTGNEMIVKDVMDIQTKHKDCLPELI